MKILQAGIVLTNPGNWMMGHCAFLLIGGSQTRICPQDRLAELSFGSKEFDNPSDEHPSAISEHYQRGSQSRICP